MPVADCKGRSLLSVLSDLPKGPFHFRQPVLIAAFNHNDGTGPKRCQFPAKASSLTEEGIDALP